MRYWLSRYLSSLPGYNGTPPRHSPRDSWRRDGETTSAGGAASAAAALGEFSGRRRKGYLRVAEPDTPSGGAFYGNAAVETTGGAALPSGSYAERLRPFAFGAEDTPVPPPAHNAAVEMVPLPLEPLPPEAISKAPDE